MYISELAQNCIHAASDFVYSHFIFSNIDGLKLAGGHTMPSSVRATPQIDTILMNLSDTLTIPCPFGREEWNIYDIVSSIAVGRSETAASADSSIETSMCVCECKVRAHPRVEIIIHLPSGFPIKTYHCLNNLFVNNVNRARERESIWMPQTLKLVHAERTAL